MSIHLVWDHVLSSGFVSFQSRINLSGVSKNLFRRLQSDEALLEGVIYENFSGQMRFLFWKWALQRRHSLPSFSLLPPYKQTSSADASSHCNSTGETGEIMRDVHRTFPTHPFFHSGPGEKMLGRILRSVAESSPEVGYCQGMNFVAGALLLSVLPSQSTGGLEPSLASCTADEDDASAQDMYLLHSDHFDEIAESEVHLLMLLLIHPLGNIQLESIWRPGVPKMKLRVFQFDRLLKWNLPRLYEHLSAMSISSEIIVSQWFMTLFSYTIPLPLTVHIWDYIFIGGWPAIFKVTLGMLRVLENKLLAMDIEEIGLLLRDWKRGKFSLSCDSHEVLRMAHRYGVTESTLISLQEAYAIEIMTSVTGLCTLGGRGIDEECVHPPGGVSWILRFGDVTEEMEKDLFRVQSDLQNMDAQVEQDKMFLQRKIINACEACERTYEQLETAQRDAALWFSRVIEINQQLVMVREKVAALSSEIDALSPLTLQVDQSLLTSIEPMSLVEIERLASEDVMVMDESIDDGCVYTEEAEDSASANSAGSPAASLPINSVDSSNLFQRVISIGRSRSSSSQESSSVFQGSCDEGSSRTFPLLGDITSPVSSPNRSTSEPLTLIDKLKTHPHRRRHEVSQTTKPSMSWSSHRSSSKSEIDTEDASLFKASIASKMNSHDDVRTNTHIASTETAEMRASPLGSSKGVNAVARPKPNLRLRILRDSVDMIFKATGLTNFLMDEETKRDEDKAAAAGDSTAETSFDNEECSDEDEEVVAFNSAEAVSRIALQPAQQSSVSVLTKELKAHKRIIVNLTKKLDYATKKFSEFAAVKNNAELSDEEARQWKESLCEQFQLLVQDWTRGRSQKLQYITDTYGI